MTEISYRYYEQLNEQNLYDCFYLCQLKLISQNQYIFPIYHKDMSVNFSIIGDAKYQELKMSFQFKSSEDKLIVLAHVNNEIYEAERMYDPDFDFEDIKEDLLNKLFKIITHTPQLLKLKVGKYMNLELKNIQKIQAASLKQNVEDLTKRLNIQVDKNNSFEKTTLQLRTEIDQMTTKFADIMQQIAESYKINKDFKNELNNCNEKIVVMELQRREQKIQNNQMAITLKNEINKCNEKIVVLELQRSEQKIQNNQMTITLNSHKKEISSLTSQIKQINETQEIQDKKYEELNYKFSKIQQQEKMNDEMMKMKAMVMAEKQEQDDKEDQLLDELMKEIQKEKSIKALELKGVSKIVVSAEEDNTIKGFFGLNKKIQSMKLLYRASENDFSAQKFHQKCDGIKNTLVLCETQYKKKIGGFTPLTWESSQEDKYKADNNSESFIFSLSNKNKFTLPGNKKDNAIKNRKEFGPIFGRDDLAISAGADKGAYSTANISNSYCNVFSYFIQDQKLWMNFCGNPNNSNKFRIVEWEVWEVEFAKKANQ